MNGKTLTAEQCSKLSLYILMTTKTREGEAEAWEKLAEEKKEDGSPKYIHAADNAQFWRELDADLRKILRDLGSTRSRAATPTSSYIPRAGARLGLNSARIALLPKRWKSSIFSISIKDFGKKKRTLSLRPTFKSTVSLQYAQT